MTYQKSPPTTGGNYAYIYELSNRLNTAYNAYAPVRAFRTGAFCCSKIFLKKFQKICGVFQKRRNDTEIAELFDTSRSTIQYRRTSSFELLKKYLEENADEWDEW